MINSIFANYHPLLGVISFIIAILSSYTGFDILYRLSNQVGRKKTFWILYGSFTIGIGIWTAHFLGMLAFIPYHSFDLSLVVISLLVAISLMFLTLVISTKAKKSKAHSHLASLFWGLSFLVLHFIGIKSFHGHIEYNLFSVLVSMLCALLPPFYILKMFMRNMSSHSLGVFGMKMISGVLIGINLMCLHYLSMVGINSHLHDSEHTTINHNIYLIVGLGVGSVVILFFFILISIIDRKFTIQSQRLAQTEQNYQSLFEHNPDIVVTLDRDGVILSINKALEKITGYKVEDWENKHFKRMIEPEYYELTNKHFMKAAKGTATNYESVLVHINGDLVHVSVTNVPIIVNDEIVGVYGIAKDISSQKRILSELALNEEKYRLITENISDIVALFSTDGRMKFCSASMERVLGYKMSDFNRKSNELVHPQDRERIDEWNQRLIQTKSEQKIEFRHKHRDGHYVYLEAVGMPIVSVSGEVNDVVLVARDITKKKQVENELIESEERYRNLVEKSPMALLVSQDDIIVYANPEAMKLYGASHADQLIGTSFEKIVHPDSLEHFKNQVEDVLKGKEQHFQEYKLFTLDKRPIVVEGSGAKIMYNGKPALLAMGKDLTEQKVLEEQLTINEQRYQSLFEYNKDAVYSFDLKGKFTNVNKATEQLSGYSSAELYNMSFEEIIHPDELSKAKTAFDNAMKGSTETLYLNVVHKSGKLVYVNVTNIPIVIEEEIVGIYGIAKDITEQKKAQDMVQHMAYHDHLTGLPNRSMLERCLSTGLERSTKKAVLFIDLDRFKVINDTLGHTIGDQLLKEVAERLKCSVNENDMVFRQGGDEFIVILENVDRDHAAKIAERMIEVLSKPTKINEYDIFTSPSIGISLYPDDGETGEILIKHADFAMYQAKSAGKKTYKFYSSNKDKSSYNSLEMEMELHKAIQRNELVLHYQPKVDLKTGKISGAEALIRWNHPEWGIVSPAVFIPIAEETGQIISIGEWVIYTACAQNKTWHDKGFSDMVISVNLSARQFSQVNLVHAVAKILNDTGLDPQYLELEITESMTTDIERTITTLKDLKRLGVRISIDDFGTGFSSLNYLKRFPVDTLKIDQSFVRDLNNNLNDETILKTIISMAHNLNLNVVAEGIETKEHLVFLQQYVCNEGQGYYFSKPVLAEEFESKFKDIEKIVTSCGISQDLNDRIWAEKLIQNARKELQETIRLQQGMTMKFKKVNGRFIHTLFDGELVYQLGLVPEQTIGKELIDFIPVEKAKEKTKFYQRAWDGEENVTYEGELNGIYYLAALSPIKRGGEIVEIIGSCIDITKLKETEKALRKSQEMYRLMAENMKDLISIYDVNGTTVYASPSHETVLGYPLSHFEGRKLFNLFPEADQEKHKLNFMEMIRTKQAIQREIRLNKLDGSFCIFETVLTPILDEKGNVQHVIGVARNITEKRKAEELLRRSEKLTIAGEIAAEVAQEIRNPMTSIKGLFQLLKKGTYKPEYFDIIQAEITLIEEIINEFLKQYNHTLTTKDKRTKSMTEEDE
ncbi:PAS domain S-box protein [Metabacillus bambusae]|uniref:histidine kinase n=1 Tax=Metabacillus bambusae TaxID=2795218 RepID=A0ABS3N6X0_9BACI|nr:PAS domain S-box protein [Metabacillus bambusae]MBO1513928.1 PAS domain S-box protein [Metabacillus bambusae]